MHQSYGQNLEESNDDYSNEVEYPMVYQHDAKYYSSTDIQVGNKQINQVTNYSIYSR